MNTLNLDSVGHRPDGKWQFDEAVTSCFADMLKRSIPGYDAMRQLCFELGKQFVQRGTHILDLGCSRGEGLLPFINHFGAGNRYIGLDESQPMVDACREDLKLWTVGDLIDIRLHDLREGLPPLMPSLVLSVLTLQFVPIEYRQKIVADTFKILRPGGAMIVVEKCLGDDGASTSLLTSTYLRMKERHGYSSGDVAAKRKALEGVLVPNTAAGNVAMLEAEGFKVHEFWRALNFAGWIAIKPKVGQ